MCVVSTYYKCLIKAHLVSTLMFLWQKFKKKYPRIITKYFALKGLGTHGRFSASYYKGGNFVISCCFPVNIDPPEMKSTVKGKNLFPLGANSYLLE